MGAIVTGARPIQNSSLHIYSRFPVRVVRAILERLDRLLAEQPVAWEGQKTVEHILPQNPEKGEWIEFDQALRSSMTDTIGNLVLLTSRKNSSASNAPFAEKKKIYSGQGSTAAGKKRATYESAQELIGLPRWDLDAYEQRQKRHLSLLAEQWGIKEVPMGPARAAARDVVASSSRADNHSAASDQNPSSHA
nr:HNH endonuclease family protein [Bradyrhizobium sp. 146]